MKKLTAPINNEEGMATIESVPLLIVFLVLIAFSFGSFGIVHSAILNSIAARNYAFETFRHRVNLVYLRGNAAPGGGGNLIFLADHCRLHGVMSDDFGDSSSSGFVATERPIAYGLDQGEVGRGDDQFHNSDVYSDENLEQGKKYSTNKGVNPVRLITQYGICLDAKCSP